MSFFFSIHSGFAVRVVTRPGSQLLGINGRDDGPLVSSFLFCSSTYTFILVLRERVNKKVLHLYQQAYVCLWPQFYLQQHLLRLHDNPPPHPPLEGMILNACNRPSGVTVDTH